MFGLIYGLTSVGSALFQTLITALWLATCLPLAGVVVRMRANYVPRKDIAEIQLPLDADSNEGRPIAYSPSFFAMLWRVKRIEGWAGLYNGLMPSIASSVLVAFLALASLGLAVLTGTGGHRDMGIPGVMIFYISSWLLTTLPGDIVTIRAITTPYRLRSFRPIDSARILLSAAERKNIFLLYLTPGFLLAQFLKVVINLLPAAIRGAFFSFHEPIKEITDLQKVALVAIYAAVTLFGTFVLCPLEVVIAKLSVQRNREGGIWGMTGVVEGEAYNVDQDVIAYRGREREPYGGLVDCMKRVVKEEGWGALYRVWWLTLVVNFVTYLKLVILPLLSLPNAE